MWQFFLAVGLLITPVNLTFLAQGLGAYGDWFFAALAIVFLLQACTGVSMGRNAAAAVLYPAVDTGLVQRAFFAARLVIFPFLAVLLCAAAGDIFAGAIYSSLPKLVFPLIMLALVAILRLISPYRDRRMVQYLTAATVFALVLLIGLLGISRGHAPGFVASGGSMQMFLLPALLLAAGFDLGAEKRPTLRPSLWVIAILLATYAIFGEGMLAALTQDSLMGEQPYMALTFAALGAEGGVIMALAALAGCLAAMNGLLCGVREASPWQEGKTAKLIEGVLPLGGAAVLLVLGFGNMEGTLSLLMGGVAALYLAYSVANLSALQLPSSLNGGLGKIMALVGVLGSTLAVAFILMYAPVPFYAAGVMVGSLLLLGAAVFKSSDDDK